MPAASLPPGIHVHGNRFRAQKVVRGNLIRRSFSSLEEAKAFLDELRRRVSKERQAEEANPFAMLTVAELVDDWYAVHQRRLTPRGRLDYDERIRRDIGPKIGHLTVSDLVNDRDLLHRYYWDDLTPVSAKHAHTILLQAFEQALQRRRIPENPAKGQRLRSTKAREKDVPNRDQVDKIVRAADDEGDLWGLFVKLAATLGTRRGETCALKWEDFDFERERVLIRRTVSQSHDVLSIQLPKSGKPRTLHIPHPGFWRNLAGLRRRSGYLFVGWVRDPQRRAEFDAASIEKCWHPCTVNRKFACTIARLGLRSENDRPYTLHSLRHFVATRLYNKTHDWVQVAKFMGHTSPAITMELYANHVVEEGQRELGVIAAAPWWGADSTERLTDMEDSHGR